MRYEDVPLAPSDPRAALSEMTESSIDPPSSGREPEERRNRRWKMLESRIVSWVGVASTYLRPKARELIRITSSTRP